MTDPSNFVTRKDPDDAPQRSQDSRQEPNDDEPFAADDDEQDFPIIGSA